MVTTAVESATKNLSTNTIYYFIMSENILHLAMMYQFHLNLTSIVYYLLG